jgi:DNA replication regulator SLD3
LILPRSYLPLSYLDTAASSTAVPTARLFTAYIRALEPEKLGGSNGQNPVILITRSEADRSLYAIEWVSRGIYAMCKLGGWVKEKALVGAALSAKEERQPAIVNQDAGDNDSTWWMSARANIPPLPMPLPMSGTPTERAGDSAAAGVLFSMKCWKPKAPLETTRFLDSNPCSRGDQSIVNMIVQSPEPMERTAATEQLAQDIFDMVRTQYFETLYISKASLAYFPKGPLSRLRAACSAGQNNPISQIDLVTFLQSLVLSLSLIDKKYKNSVPEFVASLPALNFSEDDADTIAVKGRKKRKSKMKPGKGGLYPGEDDYLRKWWMDGDSDPSVTPGETESNVEQVKRRVANLRTRETELQIILILEIFALQESSHLKEQCEERTKPNVGTSQGKNRKSSGKDLALVLDLLVDRLCIWQSVSSGGDDSLCMDNFGNPKAPCQNGKNTGPTNTRAMGVGQNSDHLRDFCNEVILPLYAATL